MELSIQHDRNNSRFYAVIDGQVSHLDYRRVGNDTLDFCHTWVPETLRNRGIGARIVVDALDWARQNGNRVIPSCPFVAAIAKRNREYADVVVGVE